MIRNARFGSILPGLVALALLGSCEEKKSGEPASDGGITEWKFAIEEIQGSVQDSYAQKFKEWIEQESDEKIKVTVYPYGSLGTSDQLTELVQNGAVQFGMASPGHLGKLIPESQVFLLHFVFSDEAEANHRVLGSEGAVFDVFAPLYEAKGLELLSVFTEGWQAWTANRAIRVPLDFEGLKIRVMTSPVLLEAYEAYGANPTPMAYSEVYSGLQLQMIDGQVNPVFAIQEMKFYEVTSHMTLARHAPFVATAVTNPEFFQSLSPERQELVRDTTKRLYEHIFEVQTSFNARRLAKIREDRPEYEILELDDDERAKFREASLPVRDSFVERTGESGKKALDTLLQEVARAEEETAPAGEEAAPAEGEPTPVEEDASTAG